MVTGEKRIQKTGDRSQENMKGRNIGKMEWWRKRGKNTEVRRQK